MNVSEVMTQPVVTVRVDAPFTEIVETLLRHDISGVPVVDQDGRLAGIVTEADLVDPSSRSRPPRRRLRRRLAGVLRREPTQRPGRETRAADLMSEHVDVADPDERVRSVARRMLRHGHKRLPVVDHGFLVGIVSRHDVLRSLARDDDDLAAEVRRVLAGYAAVMPVFDGSATVREGIVRIAGRVTYTHHSREIESAVSEIEGVRAVENRLTSEFAEFDPPTPLVS